MSFVHEDSEFGQLLDIVARETGIAAALIEKDLERTGRVEGGQLLPAVLPLVLYNGKPIWTAPRSIQSLIEEVHGGLDRYRPALEYLLIDEVRLAESGLATAPNPVGALFRLEGSRQPEDVRTVLHELVEWLRAPEQSGLRRDFTLWFARTFLPGRAPGQTIPEFHDLQEVDAMLSETVVEWTRKWKEEGEIEGKVQGKIEVARLMREEGIAPAVILRLTGVRVEDLDTDTERSGN